jgi:hypothetical protein
MKKFFNVVISRVNAQALLASKPHLFYLFYKSIMCLNKHIEDQNFQINI